jgi:hypothetical protein
MQHLPRALVGLGSYRQFIVCQLASRDGKTVKLPLDYRTMTMGNVQDPSTRATFDELQPLLTDTIKLGFVFTPDDPFFFLDLDGCFTETGQPTEVALHLMRSMEGAAVEVSQSGQGLHIIGTNKQQIDHGCKNISEHLELYTEGRFVMLTGSQAQGDVRHDCTATLPFIVGQYFPPSNHDDIGEWSEGPHEDWHGPQDDDILVGKAMGTNSAGSVFGTKATFRDLFEGNESKLTHAFPSVSGDTYDRSSADASMAQHLAFWTGNDMERMRRIMYTSALRREKWDNREGYYIPRTIQVAASRQTQFYNSNGKPTPPTTNPDTPDPGTAPPLPSGPVEAPSFSMSMVPVAMTGSPYLSIEEQVEFFKGCVYIVSINKILTPNGDFLDRPRFNAKYGNRMFELDAQARKTSKDAWVVFTNSNAWDFPKVDDRAFRPQLAGREIFQREGRSYINTYSPISNAQVPGDPSPLIHLLEKMLPEPRDRAIVMSYMAAFVQYPGHKFQYCVVLQGGEGNGKSTVADVIEFGVGEKYTHRPDAGQLAASGGKFNSWLVGNLFIRAEEMHMERKVGGGGLLNTIKPLITNKRVEVQAKGQDQQMVDNPANWLMMCNDKSDVPQTADSRRYCIFYTAQQTKNDLVKWGMDNAYWAQLHRWLNEEQGFEIMNHWLHRFEIPSEFNPATLSQAPATSSTAEAIEISKTNQEKEIVEAIESELPGFMGGWVSSMKLRDLLDMRRMPISTISVKPMLESLGYIPHPALVGGRTSSSVKAEGGKTRLYVSADHLALNMKDPTLVKVSYEKAQGYTPGGEVFMDQSAQPPR